MLSKDKTSGEDLNFLPDQAVDFKFEIDYFLIIVVFIIVILIIFAGLWFYRRIKNK